MGKRSSLPDPVSPQLRGRADRVLSFLASVASRRLWLDQSVSGCTAAPLMVRSERVRVIACRSHTFVGERLALSARTTLQLEVFAVGLTQFDEVSPFLGITTFANADGTGGKALTPSVATRLRLDGLVATNSDSVDHVVNLEVDPGSGGVHFLSATIPHGAGVGGVQAVDVLALAMPTNLVGFVIPGNSQLFAKMAVAVAGGQLVTVAPVGGYL